MSIYNIYFHANGLDWKCAIFNSQLHLWRYCTTSWAEQMNMSLPLVFSLIERKCCMKSGCKNSFSSKSPSTKSWQIKSLLHYWCTYIQGFKIYNQTQVIDFQELEIIIFFSPHAWGSVNVSHSVTGRQRKGPTPQRHERQRPELFWDCSCVLFSIAIAWWDIRRHTSITVQLFSNPNPHPGVMQTRFPKYQSYMLWAETSEIGSGATSTPEHLGHAKQTLHF